MYTKNIGEYGITLNFTEAAQVGEEVLKQVRDRRERLGKKHGLLDDYLSDVLTALSETMNANSSVDAGFDEALSDLRGLCRQIKDGSNGEALKHPFYPSLKSYTDMHSIPRDSLFYESCRVGTFKEFAVYASQRFIEDRDKKLCEYIERAGLTYLHIIHRRIEENGKVEHPKLQRYRIMCRAI